MLRFCVASAAACVAVLYTHVPDPCSAVEPPRRESAEPQVLAEFPIESPIENGNSRLIVPAVVNGHVCRLVLDTGSDGTWFDIAHRDLLGTPTGKDQVEGLVETIKIETFRPPSLEIGKIKIRPPGDVACADLHFPLVDARGERLDGILGMDVLGKVVFAIDPDARILRFYSSADTARGWRVPITWEERDYRCPMPFVRASLDGDAAERFLVDTGLGAGRGTTVAGLLAAERYDALERAGVITHIGAAADGSCTGPGGRVEMKCARSRSMLLAGFSQAGLIFGRGARVSLLGLGYLSRFHVTFDFPRGALYLQPAARYGQPDIADLSGITLSKTSGGAVITRVLHAAPAATAGLKKGDVITTVDGQDACDLTELAIHTIFAQQGRHLLEVHRGDIRKRVEILIPDAAP